MVLSKAALGTAFLSKEHVFNDTPFGSCPRPSPSRTCSAPALSDCCLTEGGPGGTGVWPNPQDQVGTLSIQTAPDRRQQARFTRGCLVVQAHGATIPTWLTRQTAAGRHCLFSSEFCVALASHVFLPPNPQFEQINVTARAIGLTVGFCRTKVMWQTSREADVWLRPGGREPGLFHLSFIHFLSHLHKLKCRHSEGTSVGANSRGLSGSKC